MEILIPGAKQSTNLLKSVKYYYDEDIGLGLTRYELGIWLVFGIFYMLRKYLVKCGEEKTVFDFMRPSREQMGRGEQSVGQEEMRRKREEMYKVNKNKR